MKKSYKRIYDGYAHAKEDLETASQICGIYLPTTSCFFKTENECRLNFANGEKIPVKKRRMSITIVYEDI